MAVEMLDIMSETWVKADIKMSETLKFKILCAS